MDLKRTTLTSLNYTNLVMEVRHILILISLNITIQKIQFSSVDLLAL